VLRSVDDLSSAKVDLRFVNPQTGPFYVEGAEPGDTLTAAPVRAHCER
jgi:acetamidase/formamidase